MIWIAILFVPAGLLLSPVILLLVIRIYRKIAHSPGPPFIHVFLDSQLRRNMQPPEEIIKISMIAPGMTILEIGSGSGAITPYLARAAGKKGKVFALDIQQEMLDMVKQKLAIDKNSDIKNVTTVLSSAHELPFKDNSIDIVIFVTVLPEVPDPAGSLQEVKRVLKTGGKLVVAELLVDPDYPLKSTTIRWGKKAGFEVEHVSGDFWHYTVRFNKKKNCVSR